MDVQTRDLTGLSSCVNGSLSDGSEPLYCRGKEDIERFSGLGVDVVVVLDEALVDEHLVGQTAQ